MKWLNNHIHFIKSRSRDQNIIEQKTESINQGSNIIYTTGDNPIHDPKDDLLGRVKIAQSFAQQVISLDKREGVSIGVLGPWGSGKTSFVNLARPEFNRLGATIIDFNPWMFSGAEQLVEMFFTELANQLKIQKNLVDIAQDIEEYGELFSSLTWLPVIGSFFEGLKSSSKILTKILQNRKKGIGEFRQKLVNKLQKLNHPIVVILDDIDRLSSSEIKEIFKLIRLTANFPNVVYIVEFDRDRVENALNDQGVPGRDYLEKILQVIIDLPKIPSQILYKQFFYALDQALFDINNPGLFDKNIWSDIFFEIISPLIRNMRDVRRYTAIIHGTVVSLDGQIALTDVLALEAIRIFLPDIYKGLYKSIEALTTVSPNTYPPQESHYLQQSIDDLINKSGDNKKIIEAMIKRLFPAAERHIGGSHYGPDWKSIWLRERRVAHEDILRFYFENVTGTGLQAFNAAERAFSIMNDRVAFENYLHSTEFDQLVDVIAAIENFEEKFTSDQVIPGIIVLLNILPTLPEKQRGIFDFGPKTYVKRVVYRLIRSLGNTESIEAAVDEILPALNSIFAKLEFILMVGYQNGIGHKLISEKKAIILEQNWRSEVRSATIPQLIQEHDLLRILIFAKTYKNPDEPQIEIPDSIDLTLAVLKSAKREEISQSIGSRTIKHSPRLAWNALNELFGSAEELKKRIYNLKIIETKNNTELLSLVEKYLNGWNPDDTDDD
jgi:predicted KAP-like P-loop ATPase